jgi:hypothetical protein
MEQLLPPQFLFRYSLPVHRREKLPLPGRRLLDLPAECKLPSFADLDDSRQFGDVRLAWNDAGFGISVEVRGKKRPIAHQSSFLQSSDRCDVWIDTRNTQSIHRASRFCHQFSLLPAGGGRAGKDPTALQLAIARAKEETPRIDPREIVLNGDIARNGYLLEAWFPASVLHGYDPEANPRLGFYYHLVDAELGNQVFSVGAEFPFSYDPSLWGTLELVP